MIIPGILEIDFNEIKNKVAIASAFAQIIQIDIADGKLVNGQTFTDITQLTFISSTKEETSDIQPKSIISNSVDIELHLMVEEPHIYIAGDKIANVKKVCSQIEAEPYIEDFIQVCRQKVYEIGLSISPDTPLENLVPFVDQIDYVQFMTVIPGGQGKTFKSGVIPKVKEFKKRFPNKIVQLDGGINKNSIKLIQREVNPQNVVVGSGIFKSENPAQEYNNLLELIA